MLEASNSIQVDTMCHVNVSPANKRLRFKVAPSAVTLEDTEIEVVSVNTLPASAAGARRKNFGDFTQKKVKNISLFTPRELKTPTGH